MGGMTVEALRAEIARRWPRAIPMGMAALGRVSTGLPALDAAMGGGWPRGLVVDLAGRPAPHGRERTETGSCGTQGATGRAGSRGAPSADWPAAAWRLETGDRRSGRPTPSLQPPDSGLQTPTGRTGLMLTAMARLTADGGLAGWVDGPWAFHPPEADRWGVDLARLLVVRPGDLAWATWAAGVMAAGGLDLVVVDVSMDPPVAGAWTGQAKTTGQSPPPSAPPKEAENPRRGRTPDSITRRRLERAAARGQAAVVILGPVWKAPWPGVGDGGRVVGLVREGAPGVPGGCLRAIVGTGIPGHGGTATRREVTIVG